MIELKHLSKTFETAGGRVDALKDVSLTIPDGDVYGIIGMSGAGKSTLVRCINMLETADSGSITVDGGVVFDGSNTDKLSAQQQRENQRQQRRGADLRAEKRDDEQQRDF